MSVLLDHRFDGEGDEVVLPLNGGMMTWAVWEPVTGPLRTDWRVLSCDLQGQLRSPGNGHPRLEDHVPDLLALLDALDIEAVHALGTSFGGEVGMLLAAEAPSRVRSLAVVTAADRTPPGMYASARRLNAMARDVLDGGDPRPLRAAIEEDVFSPAFRTTQADLLAERRRVALPASWYQGLLGILQSVEQFDLTGILGRIVCPTLVVHAANDRVMPEARVRALVEGIEGAELQVHPTSGHALVVEDPAWLVDVYREFLARHAGTSS